MKQQLFARGKRLRPGTEPGYMLKLDGVNDVIASTQGSDFYNVGIGAFSFLSSFIPYGSLNTTTGFVTVGWNFFSKRTKNNPSDFLGYLFSFTLPGGGSMRFVNLFRNGSQAGEFQVSSPNSLDAAHAALKVGELNRVAFVRDTQTSADLRNMSRYKLVINGQSFPLHLARDTAEPNYSNTETFRVCENSSIQQAGYLKDFEYYAAALSDAQISEYMLTGAYPNDAGKLFYSATQKAGKVMPDGSSVGNNGTLENYTDLETGIPNPATNRVWCCPAAYFDANGTKTFKAAKDLTITRIARGFSSSLQATAVHRRGGNMLGTYTLDFPSSNINTGLSIDMLAGDELEFTVSNITAKSQRGFIEIFY